MDTKNIDPVYLQSATNAAASRTYRLAVRLGLSTADREDMQQELILDMLERAHSFDPAKACANTFTGMVSEHRAIEVTSALLKDRARMCFFSGSTAAANDSDMDDAPDDVGDNVVPMWADDRDLFADSMTLRDLEKAKAFMSDNQLTLFDLLEAYQDLPSACAACGTSTATFYRRVAELQMHLRMFGIRSAA